MNSGKYKTSAEYCSPLAIANVVQSTHDLERLTHFVDALPVPLSCAVVYIPFWIVRSCNLFLNNTELRHQRAKALSNE
jgi:hypothetical protein